MAESGKITTRAQDYGQWYQDVIREGDLAQPAEVVKGCMVIKPHGYAIWEKIQADLDRRFKATGHKNAYFPLLVPMSFIKKEAQHVEGFAPWSSRSSPTPAAKRLRRAIRHQTHV